ncbi:MAG: DUF3896 family protein [Bacilli bacterium]
MGRRTLVENSIDVLTEKKTQLLEKLTMTTDDEIKASLQNQINNVEYILALTDMNANMRGCK